MTALLAAVTAAGLAVGGCGTPAAPGARHAPVAGALPLATSLATGPVTWAVVPMGAATSGPGQFWELFRLSPGGTRWTLHTPPDVPTNGAIAVTAAPGGTLVAGIHPSARLAFSPVAVTADGGRTWHTGTPDPGLAPVPDALAAAPAGTGLLALVRAARAGAGSRNGSGSGRTATGLAAVTARSATATSRTPLVTVTALAATPAGRACGVADLRAVAFTPAGQPVLGGDCRRPGVAGIFLGPAPGAGGAGTDGATGRPETSESGPRSETAEAPAAEGRAATASAPGTAGTPETAGPPEMTETRRAAEPARTAGTSGIAGTSGTAGAWRAVGLRLPAAMRRQRVRLLRLTLTGRRLTALLRAGTDLVAAWTADGRSWAVSRPLTLPGSAGSGRAAPPVPVLSASPGSDGEVAVVLAGRQAAVVAGPGAEWQPLPALPSAPHVTLALPADGGVMALATSHSVLTVWRLSRPAGAWTRVQRVTVPVQNAAAT